MRHIRVREKVKGSGCWWVFVNYNGKRTSKKVGLKWMAEKAAREIRVRLFLPTRYLKSKKTPMERLNHNMSCTIQAVLNGAKKRRSWESLVNYTTKDLKKHLEKQFTDGMTWDNYGRWHVDHIIPKSYFEFDTPEDKGFQKCWALSNLRPLWGSENCSKGAKIFLHLNAPPVHPEGYNQLQPNEIMANN